MLVFEDFSLNFREYFKLFLWDFVIYCGCSIFLFGCMATGSVVKYYLGKHSKIDNKFKFKAIHSMEIFCAGN